MFKLLNEEIERDFNKAENFNAIMSKIEGENSMKKFNIKYVLVPTFMIIILVICIGAGILISGSGNGLIANANKPLGGLSVTNKPKEDVIYINEYTKHSADSIAGKLEEGDLHNEYGFLNNTFIPENMKIIREGKLYIGSNTKGFTFRENEIIFATDDYKSRLQISFGPNELIGNACYIIPERETKVSVISGIEVEIFANKLNDDNAKVYGEADFKCNELNFKVEVSRITMDEYIQVIRSIIANVK